jgi:hypothetical protein
MHDRTLAGLIEHSQRQAVAAMDQLHRPNAQGQYVSSGVELQAIWRGKVNFRTRDKFTLAGPV